MGKIAALRADKAVSEALRPVAVRKYVMTPGEAAYALWHADMILRSTPTNPAVAYVHESRKQHYDECLADMKRALENV